MNAVSPELAGGAGWVHPRVLDRRASDRMLLALGVLVPVAIALAVSIAIPKPSLHNVLLLAGARSGCWLS